MNYNDLLRVKHELTSAFHIYIYIYYHESRISDLTEMKKKSYWK